jgi:hypothetical protein
MFAQRYQTAALLDVANLLLGMLLFFAPWVFGFVSDVASENAWLSGSLVGLLATTAILAYDAREQRLTLLVGLWVTISPWVLGFHAEMHIHLLVGLLLVALALLELWLDQGTAEAMVVESARPRGLRSGRIPLAAVRAGQDRRGRGEKRSAAAPRRHAAADASR